MASAHHSPVATPTIRPPVGGRHNYHPTVKECSEEPLEDHGIGNVSHLGRGRPGRSKMRVGRQPEPPERYLELVKAEQAGLGRNGLGHGGNGVVHMRLATGRGQGQTPLQPVNAYAEIKGQQVWGRGGRV